MTHSSASIVMLMMALAAFFVAGIVSARGKEVSALSRGLLCAAVVLAGAFHIGLLREYSGAERRLSAPRIQLHDTFHYYMGTKYFDEVGYEGLYLACILADYEDDRRRFIPDAPYRDLRDNQLDGQRADVPPQSAAIKAPFSDARWADFKADLAVFRGALRPEFWHGTGFYVDHGYNGTPLVTAILGGLAQQPFTSTTTYIQLMRWADLEMIVLVAIFAGLLYTPVVGLTFLFFFFANPLNEYGFVGGSYLRYLYLVTLALGLLCIRERLYVAAGALLAVSGWLRIFPLVLPALLGLQQLVGRDPRTRIRQGLPLMLSFAITSLIILAGTSLTVGGDRTPWLAFADNIRGHAGAPGINRVGLEVAGGYSPENARRLIEARGSLEASRIWEEQTHQTLEARRPIIWLASALLLALAIASLRWLPEAGVVLPWLVAIWTLLALSDYYWAVLCLIPLALGNERTHSWILLASCFAMAWVAAPWITGLTADLRFALFSAVVLATLAALLWSTWPRDAMPEQAADAPPG
jgi:hypothetical protein